MLLTSHILAGANCPEAYHCPTPKSIPFPDLTPNCLCFFRHADAAEWDDFSHAGAEVSLTQDQNGDAPIHALILLFARLRGKDFGSYFAGHQGAEAAAFRTIRSRNFTRRFHASACHKPLCLSPAYRPRFSCRQSAHRRNGTGH